ncbi:hypothetical protein GCM10027598_34240 [Amycolatopsis oliviviridis]|uniref:Uncharacterized protein n=1 Tax=Amycolatopsis oliviviridis TaxID=1471590 RepID=A0ABQ3LQ84_9PSEU|nr:hypothetical protein GCM10017790_45920 [Amycolatopsis oliviviridis]
MSLDGEDRGCEHVEATVVVLSERLVCEGLQHGHPPSLSIQSLPDRYGPNPLRNIAVPTLSSSEIGDPSPQYGDGSNEPWPLCGFRCVQRTKIHTVTPRSEGPGITSLSIDQTVGTAPRDPVTGNGDRPTCE